MNDASSPGIVRSDVVTEFVVVQRSFERMMYITASNIAIGKVDDRLRWNKIAWKELFVISLRY